MADKKKINKAQLKDILSQHAKWLDDDSTGKCADLRGVDLSKADLHGTDLSCADLRGANLSGANLTHAELCDADLRGANLHGADLSCACLFKADLSGANLSGADLSGANLSSTVLDKALLYKASLSRADLDNAILDKTNLSRADLYNASLSGADLSRADLSGANLSGADLRGAIGLSTVKCDILTAGFKMTPPATGEYVAWKSAGEHIIKLLIPASAKRSSATTRKCRASKATVLGIYTLKGKPAKITTVYSNYDSRFAYTVGETVSVSDFDQDRWAECASGIHHFLSMEEAIEWAD